PSTARVSRAVTPRVPTRPVHRGPPTRTPTSWTPRSSTRTTARATSPDSGSSRGREGRSQMAQSDKNNSGTGDNGEETEGPVIRDNRRVDPETGEIREPDTAGQAPEDQVSEEAGADGEPVADEDAEEAPEVPDTPEDLVSEAINADERVVELTNDIKRVQAEYANYRKRVERDRVAVREAATAKVVGELLPILDDIGRAREHDELTGGFKAVG